MVHFFIEIAYIRLLIIDFHKWGLGLDWAQWYTIHRYLGIILAVAGLVFGFKQGVHWWDYIYVKNKLKRNFFKY